MKSIKSIDMEKINLKKLSKSELIKLLLKQEKKKPETKKKINKVNRKEIDLDKQTKSITLECDEMMSKPFEKKKRYT